MKRLAAAAEVQLPKRPKLFNDDGHVKSSFVLLQASVDNANTVWVEGESSTDARASLESVLRMARLFVSSLEAARETETIFNG